jgi:hypothetical protein
MFFDVIFLFNGCGGLSGITHSPVTVAWPFLAIIIALYSPLMEFLDPSSGTRILVISLIAICQAIA